MKKNKRHTFIIAEIATNHGCDFDRAVALIKKAKECGADAVKFQLYTPETMTIDCDSRYFRIKHPRWGGQTLHELYRKSHTPWKWFRRLKKVAEDRGISFFATAYDKSSIDFLEELNVPIYKIASFELNDLPLIEYAAKTKKPLIISTGMGTFAEIGEAVNTAKKKGAKEIILLHCVSSYPAKPEEMNLRTILDMKKRFKCTVGLSDHTPGTAVALSAVSLGAKVIEKHFTLSRKFKTQDSFFSIEPAELKYLAENVWIVEKALGRASYALSEGEKKMRIFRRSLFTAEDIRKGDVFTEKNIRSIRPANGLSPACITRILRKKAKCNIKKGTPLAWNLVCKK